MDEALNAYARLTAWLSTPSALRCFYTAGWQSEQLAAMTDRERWRYWGQVLADSRELFAEFDVIYADPPMVELLVAAADALPEEPVHPEDLIAPSGMVLFAQPLPVLQITSTADQTRAPIRPRAMSWSSSPDGLNVVTWCDRVGTYTAQGLDFTYTGLAPESLTTMGWQATDTVIPAGWRHVNVLRALGRLSRQPTTVVDEPPVSPRARRAAAKARRGAPASIRRVYLRHPHLAAHELQAARDARAGHPPRGHYVRGHWRHQWYPSIEEHRLVWVDGYLRGEFTAGVVPGTKVLVAHAAPGETATAS